jgi:hypothetical protein
MHDLLLVMGLLGHSSWLRGQEDERPGCSDVGTDSPPQLSVLTVLLLLLLRKLPLVLVLVLTLMLMLVLVLVTLLELLWRVA